MDSDKVLQSLLNKLKQFEENKVLLLVSLLNTHSWLLYQNQMEKAKSVYEEIYLLQCLICDDALMKSGYLYNESGEYPLWEKSISY